MICTEDEYKEFEELSVEFKSKLAWKLQSTLKFYSLTKNNYMSEMWLKYAYLHNRKPLMVNNNYYGIVIEIQTFKKTLKNL